MSKVVVGNIQIVEYNSAYRQRFKEITEQWIVNRYSLEEEDIKLLNSPEKYILANDGKIFIALSDSFPVGVVAYLNLKNHNYQLVKMGVDEKYRERKIGERMLEVTLNKMKENGAKKIFLYSNTVGSKEAVHLYYKLGFVKIDLGVSAFKRVDIQMELSLV